MEDRLARYLDGDLDEAQAAALLRATREDPALERELRGYEDLLQAAEALPDLAAPVGLADRIMSEVRGEGAAAAVATDGASMVGAVSRRLDGRREPRIRTGQALRWRTARPAWLAAAAALAVEVLVGAWLFSPMGAEPDGAPGSLLTADSDAASLAGPVAPVALAAPLESGHPPLASYRLVRLSYPVVGSDVRSVAVAGTFNGWDRTSLPMSRGPEGWSLLLLLPPGQHEYMFVVNGERWVTDPDATRTRDDGFGGANGVLEVRT